MQNKNINRLLAVCLLSFIFTGASPLFAGEASGLFGGKKKPKQSEVKPVKTSTPYTKLFDKKEVETSAGLMKIHRVEGKVYIEVPRSVVGRPMIVTSGVERMSDLMVGYMGQRVSQPLQICFSLSDTTMYIRQVSRNFFTDSDDEKHLQSIKNSSIDPVLLSTPVLATSPDDCLVIDATGFFLSKERASFNFSFGISATSTKFKKELSLPKKVEAFPESISVVSDLTFGVAQGLPMFGIEGPENMISAEIRTTIALLPEQMARPRLADSRIGIAVTPYLKYSFEENGVHTKYFANRWKLEPGVREEIVFYVDTLMPAAWRRSIKEGLVAWNKAFEKIGFGNVIRVKDYPSAQEDPSFSAANIAYNCVKYSLMPLRDISSHINYDPRTGEIMSASIIIYGDTPVTMQRERITQTSAIEPGVNAHTLPEEMLCQALRVSMMHHMGLCLGLTPNTAASSWMPVDSLRSPSFTQREGISSSVMDKVKYNYVAQPGDPQKGVKIMLDGLGVYDYYAIEWLYRPFDASCTAEEEAAALKRIIDSRLDDPRFFYGKQQPWYTAYDPRSLNEDLGNDKVAAAKYALRNLEHLCNNAGEWLAGDGIDDAYRELFLDFILLRFQEHVANLVSNIGGIYITEKYSGDPEPAYKPVPRQKQKEAMHYLLTLAEDMSRMDNKKTLRAGGLNTSLAESLENSIPRYFFYYRLPMVDFCAFKSDDPYTLAEAMRDITDFTLKDIRKNKAPKRGNLGLLKSYVSYLIGNSALPNVEKANRRAAGGAGINDNYVLEEMELTNGRLAPVSARRDISLGYNAGSTDGFGPLTIPYKTSNDNSRIYYSNLLEIKHALEAALPRTSDVGLKENYSYMLLRINKALGK